MISVGTGESSVLDIKSRLMISVSKGRSSVLVDMIDYDFGGNREVIDAGYKVLINDFSKQREVIGVLLIMTDYDFAEVVRIVGVDICAG